MSRLIAVNVTLGPEALRSADATLRRLREAGLEQAQLLEAVGIVSGRVAEDKLAALAKLPGVAVERDEAVRIPPPEADLQ